RPGQALFMSHSLSTFTHVILWAGGSAETPMPVLFWMLWSKRCMIDGPRIAVASSITATVAANIYRSNILNAWPRQASNHRLEAWVTAMTTLWPRRSMAFTKPRSFTGAGLGARSRRLNMPRWNGGTGSITSACLSPSETSRLLKPRKTITPCWTKPTWQLNLNQIASGNPGAVHNSRSSDPQQTEFRRVVSPDGQQSPFAYVARNGFDIAPGGVHGFATAANASRCHLRSGTENDSGDSPNLPRSGFSPIVDIRACA